MTLEAFAKLKVEGKDAMKDRLTGSLNLRLGGKKADSISRYTGWYNAQGGMMPPPPAENNIPVTPMLPRILKGHNKRVPDTTRKCVHDLEYTPGKDFRLKTSQKDISDSMQHIKTFVKLLIGLLPMVKVTTSPGTNELMLRKALSEELDIVQSALQHRLVRWAGSFPRPGIADQLWPTTYSEKERKAIREYVVTYIQEHGLNGPELPEEAEETSIQQLQHAADFPVALGRTKGVIKAVTKDCRAMLQKRTRKEAAKDADANRTAHLGNDQRVQDLA